MARSITNNSTADLGELAKLAGFQMPVQITIGVQKLCEAHKSWYGGNNPVEGLWSVLTAAKAAFRKKTKDLGSSEKVLSKRSVTVFRVRPQRKPGVEELDLWLVFSENKGFIITLPNKG